MPLAPSPVEFVPVAEELLPAALDEFVAEEFEPDELLEFAVELVPEVLEELVPVEFPADADEFVELEPAGDVELVPEGDVEFDPPPSATPLAVPLVELLPPTPELVEFPPDEEEVALFVLLAPLVLDADPVSPTPPPPPEEAAVVPPTPPAGGGAFASP